MELIVDLFAGGGGASSGIYAALGRHPDIAVNHDPEAIAMHRANHPSTSHVIEDIWHADPTVLTGDQPVGLLWASPSCTHFSKARGGKPLSKQLRSLGWAVVWWAAKTRPRIIILENVSGWASWGPVDPEGRLIPHRKGESFLRWKKRLEFYGYKVEKRELSACDYGAPTTRKRLFVIARRDGKPIVWPKPTHGPSTNQPYRTAAEIIDFGLPCPSIFGRKKPLAEATLKRIAKGIMRYVVNNPKPFIVPIAHYNGRDTVHGVDEPLKTVVASGAEFALVAPSISSYYGHQSEEGNLRGRMVSEPLPTQSTENRFAVVAAFLAKHYSDSGQRPGTPLSEPVSTVTSIDHHSLAVAHLTKQNSESLCAAQSNRFGLVAAFLTQYYGTAEATGLEGPLNTVTANDHFGLVVVYIEGQPHIIADIGLRMLTPKELFAAQGFPADYSFEEGVAANGQRVSLSKTAQVRMCGNSVPPAFAEALVRANYLGGAQSAASD